MRATGGIRLRDQVLRLAVVLPLLLAALFPVGLMARTGADGQMVMVLCTGDGPVQMVLDPVTGQFHKAPPTSDRTGCDWAMSQVAGDIAPPAPLPLPPDAMSRAAPALAVALWRPAHDPRGIWARGPPASV